MDEYQKVVSSLKRRKKGATVADISAATALPLSTVRELLPKAADEYSGHLQVTQSGEILYYFQNGFKSRYRGFGASLSRAFNACAAVVKKAAALLFKIWIMVMLVGYFLLFIALALASVVLSMAAQSRSSSSSSRRGGFFGFNMFSLIWRIWFYSEITKPRGYGNQFRSGKPKRPMHKAIFSFIFGEEDPNKDFVDSQAKAVISYLQANRGVITLAEYMAFTGESSPEAEQSILAFCSKFGGSPEVTEEGVIVYRFDELLLRSDTQVFGEMAPPVKRLKTFSSNKKNMNVWFTVINAVNLFFGSYFLYQSFSAGRLITEIQYQAASYLYSFTHLFLDTVMSDPHIFMRGVLGIVPLVFSVLFWLVPAVRYFMEKRENRGIKLSNFKRIAFGKIWASPKKVDITKLAVQTPECRPDDFTEAADRAVKELGAISEVEVELDETGRTLYSFNGLENEKLAVRIYRASIDPGQSKLGEKVFDTV